MRVERKSKEIKVACCPRGAISDVIIGLKPDSPTFKKWLDVNLTEGNATILYALKAAQRVTDLNRDVLSSY